MHFRIKLCEKNQNCLSYSRDNFNDLINRLLILLLSSIFSQNTYRENISIKLWLSKSEGVGSNVDKVFLLDSRLSFRQIMTRNVGCKQH